MPLQIEIGDLMLQLLPQRTITGNDQPDGMAVADESRHGEDQMVESLLF